MGHHPMDYHQKRHLSPPDAHSRGTSVLDDDYMSDTSDMSSLGMNPHRSMGKDKKQYEGVDFELLQGNKQKTWILFLISWTLSKLQWGTVLISVIIY